MGKWLSFKEVVFLSVLIGSTAYIYWPGRFKPRDTLATIAPVVVPSTAPVAVASPVAQVVESAVAAVAEPEEQHVPAAAPAAIQPVVAEAKEAEPEDDEDLE